MDEYRPYPAEPPEDLPEAEEHDAGEEAPQAQAEPAGAEPHQDTGVEPGEELPAEEEEAAESKRPPRAEPNLDHPGGHLHGVIARVNRPRRFGFLRADDGAEVFFHASALEAGPNAFDALRPGQEMEFDCHQDEQGRGLAATAVTIIGEPPERPERPERAERPERQPRAPKQERQERPERGARGKAAGWRVVVLTERGDQAVSAQLERLLNERSVKPGNFTFNLTETDEGVECWVAIHGGQ